jgi:FlaG/FlaF family flagellin (archaellin)
MDYEATTPKGTEKFAYKTFGGSSVLDSAGGTRLTQNHNKTGGQFFQAVTAIAAGVSAAYTKNSDNALSATQAKQATAQQANARTPTIVPAQAVKPDTTVFPLVVPPPKAVVP